MRRFKGRDACDATKQRRPQKRDGGRNEAVKKRGRGKKPVEERKRKKGSRRTGRRHEHKDRQRGLSTPSAYLSLLLGA